MTKEIIQVDKLLYFGGTVSPRPRVAVHPVELVVEPRTCQTFQLLLSRANCCRSRQRGLENGIKERETTEGTSGRVRGNLKPSDRARRVLEIGTRAGFDPNSIVALSNFNSVRCILTCIECELEGKGKQRNKGGCKSQLRAPTRFEKHARRSFELHAPAFSSRLINVVERGERNFSSKGSLGPEPR